MDASYGVHVDGKSHSGMCMSLGAGCLLAHSNKQKIVTKASAEAELVCTSDKGSSTIHGKEFLRHQGYQAGATLVMQDNQSAMRQLKNGVESVGEKSRHIKIRYFWIKDRIANGDLEVMYCNTTEMIADILTKPLQGKLFLKLRKLLLNME